MKVREGSRGDFDRDGCGCQNRFGIPFWWVGKFAAHFRTYFGGDWDVHWGKLGHPARCPSLPFLFWVGRIPLLK